MRISLATARLFEADSTRRGAGGKLAGSTAVKAKILFAESPRCMTLCGLDRGLEGGGEGAREVAGVVARDLYAGGNVLGMIKVEEMRGGAVKASEGNGP